MAGNQAYARGESTQEVSPGPGLTHDSLEMEASQWHGSDLAHQRALRPLR